MRACHGHAPPHAGVRLRLGDDREVRDVGDGGERLAAEAVCREAGEVGGGELGSGEALREDGQVRFLRKETEATGERRAHSI